MAREDELSAFPMEKIGKYILIFRTFRYKRPIVGYKNGGVRAECSGGIPPAGRKVRISLNFRVIEIFFILPVHGGTGNMARP